MGGTAAAAICFEPTVAAAAAVGTGAKLVVTTAAALGAYPRTRIVAGRGGGPLFTLIIGHVWVGRLPRLFDRRAACQYRPWVGERRPAIALDLRPEGLPACGRRPVWRVGVGGGAGEQRVGVGIGRRPWAATTAEL